MNRTSEPELISNSSQQLFQTEGNPEEDSKRTGGGTLRTALIMAASIALSIGLVIFASRHEEAIKDFVTHAGVFAPLVMIVLYGVLGLSPIPSEPLTLINGALFGSVWGTLVAGTGNLAAAVVEYYLGKGINNLSNFEERRRNLPFGLGNFPADSIWFLLGARFVPGYGPKLVSVVGGVYKVPLRRYIWTAAIPTYVGAALFALSGYGLSRLF
jgi:uncharacterized membrane protein YdjX (TVP38/TMEM64 family)